MENQAHVLLGRKILLVDDTPANLDVLCNVLESEGYDLAIASEGALALKIADQMQPDLILLDIMMPHMDGFEVCRALKERTELQDVPVIFISARDQTRDVLSGFQVGGVDYITKPFKNVEVLARVETHLYLRFLKQELYEKNQALEKQNQTLEKTIQQLSDTQDQMILQEKMASLGRLVAGIAHEINTPIGAINSAADVAQRCIQRLTQQETIHVESAQATNILDILQNNIHTIDQAGIRIAKTVQELRSFAHLDEGEVQEVDLHEGLERTLSLLQHDFNNRVKVVKTYGPLPSVFCNPREMNQVFMNILVNAQQAIEGVGEIRIETGIDGTHIWIKISDTGTGILPEDLKKIFNPGFTTKGVGVGTGLGLSLCYHIVQKHQGKIDVISEPQKGTEVTLLLPLRAHNLES